MMPQRLEPRASTAEVEAVADRWKISCALAWKLHKMASLMPWPVQLVSGYRTEEHEQTLEGAPAPGVSTHTSCPATGADLQVIGYTKDSAPDHVRRVFGAAAQQSGLRWGGGSSDRMGVPSDWNHVDMGRRVR